jgi:hypothetical protein
MLVALNWSKLAQAGASSTGVARHGVRVSMRDSRDRWSGRDQRNSALQLIGDLWERQRQCSSGGVRLRA